MKCYRVVITPGEPSGVGPDLIVKLAQYNWPIELVVCTDGELLKNRSKLLGLPLTLLPYVATHKPAPQKAGTLVLLPILMRVPAVPGKLRTENSYYVLETLTRACDGCMNGEFSALITGPVHKGIINKAGIPFTGHTEFFEKRSHSRKAVMMLVTEIMRVALVTNHIPIKDVSNVIKKELLSEVITILHNDLCIKFNISQPHILVCGLNPHAGEDGYIGTEEIDIIIPVLEYMRAKGIKITGPLPADTIFQSKYTNCVDVILAMYHDQGLPVLKYQGFGQGVNITLGLPFIRTSVDHGTALDLAGNGKVNIGSFNKALNFAIKMVFNTYHE